MLYKQRPPDLLLIWMKEYENETVPQQEQNGEIKDRNRENGVFIFTGLFMEGPDPFSDANKHG